MIIYYQLLQTHTIAQLKFVTNYLGSMSVWVNATTGKPVDYYSVELDEEVPANTLVCEVKATIPDAYQTAESFTKSDSDMTIEYSIVADNESSAKVFYEIDRLNGRIVTTGVRIDYEQEEVRRLAQSVKVRAQSRDKFFTYFTHIAIDIRDVNDNAPRFDELLTPRVLEVVENSTMRHVIGRVRATDADSDVNGVVQYRLLTNNSLFTIGNTLVNVYTK